MRLAAILAGALAVTALGAAHAQTPPPVAAPPDMKAFASSAEVVTLIAKAKASLKPGQPTAVQSLMRLKPYAFFVEYRVAVGPAAVHENEAEVFYVIDGGGTLMLGGKLADEKRTDPTNLRGTAIAGGSSQHVGKGDFFVVPQNTPHWFSAIDGTLVLMSVHLPGG